MKKMIIESLLEIALVITLATVVGYFFSTGWHWAI
jgi:hypothetical protein